MRNTRAAIGRLSAYAGPPILESDHRTRLARMVYYVGIGLILSVVIPLSTIGSLREASTPIVLALVLEILVVLAALFLNAKGMISQAVILLAGSLQLVTTTIVISSQAGFRDTSILIYPATLVAASLMLSRRLYAGFAVSTVVLVGSVLVAGMSGLYSVSPPPFPDLFDLLDVMVILSMTALATGLLSDGIRTSLAKARFNEQALAESFKKLEEQSAMLMDSERRYREVVEHASELIVITDADLRVKFANESAVRVMGFREGSAAGQNLLVNLPEITRAAIMESLDDRMRGDERVGVIDFPVTTGDGRSLWLSVNVSLLRAGSSDAGWHWVGRDVTVKKLEEEEIYSLNAELERRVDERTEDLQSALSELETISYSVSHEMRAPIRHILSYAHMLEDHLQTILDAPGRRYLASMMFSTRWMGGLVDGLLAFIRAGRGELQVTDVNLNALFDQVRTELLPLLHGRTIKWVDSSLPLIAADLSLMKLVLKNLLSNALKFTRSRPAATVEIGSIPSSSNDRMVTIFVRDNGIGFDQVHAGKLFGVFQRLHTKNEYEGTGVGLAIVRRIIQRHGGLTWAEGLEEKGATVYFTLPSADSRVHREEV